VQSQVGRSTTCEAIQEPDIQRSVAPTASRPTRTPCKAKERSLPRPGDGTLLRVDLELEASLDEAGQTRHDPVAGAC
jgi:hypothetical protein